MKNILCVIGTRPEAIKMAPLILELKNTPRTNVEILNTSQHKDLVNPILNLFDISSTRDLNVMSENQTVTSLTSKLLTELEKVLTCKNYNLVLGVGDTTTVFSTALACFYQKISFGHVEAGLRSNNSFSPFPEEMNRVLTSKIACLHFSPTKKAADNLRKEGVNPTNIFVTGNTVIDALRLINDIIKLPEELQFMKRKKTILITLHRRENFGLSHLNTLNVIKTLASKIQPHNGHILFSVHPNPNIKLAVEKILGNHNNITLVDAKNFNYDAFIAAMKHSYFIITDSGGIQEEAIALKKPLVVLREETERMEGIEVGAAKLVSPLSSDLESIVYELFTNKEVYNAMTSAPCPYGDGFAASKIVNIINSENFLSK